MTGIRTRLTALLPGAQRSSRQPPRSIMRRPKPRWLRRADAFCGKLNRVLLAIAIGLAVAHASARGNPDAFATLIRHPEWLLPPADMDAGADSEEPAGGR